MSRVWIIRARLIFGTGAGAALLYCATYMSAWYYKPHLETQAEILVRPGDDASLNWQVRGWFTGIYLDDKQISPTGPWPIRAIKEDTEHRLEARSPVSRFSDVKGVWIRTRMIESFEADPRDLDRGGEAAISWRVSERATSVSITPEFGPVKNVGRRTLFVREPIELTLVAEGIRRETKTLSILIRQPVVRHFSVTPPQVSVGNDVQIEWDVLNCNNARLTGGSVDREIPCSGAMAMAMHTEGDVPIVLYAKGPGGDVPAQTLTIRVGPPTVELHLVAGQKIKVAIPGAHEQCAPGEVFSGALSEPLFGSDQQGLPYLLASAGTRVDGVYMHPQKKGHCAFRLSAIFLTDGQQLTIVSEQVEKAHRPKNVTSKLLESVAAKLSPTTAH